MTGDRRMKNFWQLQKKWCVVILAVLLCIGCTSCKGEDHETSAKDYGASTEEQTTTESADEARPEYLGMNRFLFEQCVDQSCVAIRMTAGADITLYLSEDGNIMAVHCHNEDAIKVCNATPTLELDFESVFFAVLNEMIAMEHLKEGVALQMRIVEEREVPIQMPLYDVIDNVIKTVNNDAGFVISMVMNSELGNVGAVIQGGGNTGDGQVPDQGEQRPDDGEPSQENSTEGGVSQPEQGGQPGDSAYLEVERDENGNLIRTVEMDDQGNRVECFYRPDGTRETEQVKLPDGAEEFTVFRADGTIESQKEIRPDGTETETIMDERGERVSMTQVMADGTRMNCTFNDDGRELYRKTTYLDGSCREENWEYDSSGALVMMRSLWSDGRMREEYFHENGMVRTQIEREQNGETRTSTFTQEGNMTSHICMMPDGTIVGEERYEYDESGKLLSEYYKNRDESFHETTYYANGNRKMQVITFSDGRTETWHYTEDGTTGTTTTISGTVKETYYSNGKTATYSFTTFPSAGLDFTYEESVYDENGTWLTHTKVKNDGVIAVSTYHYDKSHTTVFTYPDGGGHTEYWYGNNLLGGVDSNGNPWGVIVPGADYSGLDYSGTIGKG